ncbi:MAG: hypothetical protein M5U28_34015 [Sandaracinaceae bacterium]|nr:hypothetical protein [Sandaracinaceae bacterium]
MSPRIWRASLLLPVIVLSLAAAGCIEREGRPVNPCTQVTVADRIEVNNVDKVDLLFMIDNSNSMTEEQVSLAAEIPDMIRILTSGDFDGNPDVVGPEDFDPVRDLNVGVITSDMGTGGFTVPTCARSDFGDDGILRTQGRTDMTGCSATYPNILNFRADSGVTPDAFARDVTCVANMGTGGCGFEQQLEAILKAVTPTGPQTWTRADFVPVGTSGAPHGLHRPFFRMSSPHGNVANDGFVRDNSVLAIIPLTDEEDCSAHDPELFNPSSPTYSGTDLNLRCFAHGEAALHPISRYAQGLLQLRAREQLLIYAPIVGIPVDLAPGAGERPNWDLLVGETSVRDPRMVEQVDPAMPNRLVPSCNTANGIAFPPVRIVRVAQQLSAAGAGVTVQSICQDSFAAALREIIVQIRSALGAACLPRRLNVEADGSVACDVLSVMPGAWTARRATMPSSTTTATPSSRRAIAASASSRSSSPPAPRSGPGPRRPATAGTTTTTPPRARRTASPAPIRGSASASPACSPSRARRSASSASLAVQGTGTDDIQIGTFCNPDPGAPGEENRCPSGTSRRATPRSAATRSRAPAASRAAATRTAGAQASSATSATAAR